MPISMQKQILSAIQHAQNGVVLTMGPLGDLDFEMAAAVSQFKFELFTFSWFKFGTNIFSLLGKFINTQWP